MQALQSTNKVWWQTYQTLASQRTGKKIPLDIETNEPHDYPVLRDQPLPQGQQQSQTQQPQRGCSQEIYFDASNKTESGKWIPPDKQTGLPHQCQQWIRIEPVVLSRDRISYHPSCFETNACGSKSFSLNTSCLLCLPSKWIFISGLNSYNTCLHGPQGGVGNPEEVATVFFAHMCVWGLDLSL